ncbi:hypothetical protein ANABIO32_31000 [Rossellomorea marisflavi]|nr:hypothetical protein ANABIO32_31000 [Rossellomorea marisflavi]
MNGTPSQRITPGSSCINESVSRETIKPGNAYIQAFPGNLSIQHVTRDIHRDQTTENKEQ